MCLRFCSTKLHREHARNPAYHKSDHVPLEKMSNGELRMDCLIIGDKENECDPVLVGGKAYNLWILSHKYKLNVPPWFTITSRFFARFIQVLSSIILLYKAYIVMV